MSNLFRTMNHIKWLTAIGIKYYYSNKYLNSTKDLNIQQAIAERDKAVNMLCNYINTQHNKINSFNYQEIDIQHNIMVEAAQENDRNKLVNDYVKHNKQSNTKPYISTIEHDNNKHPSIILAESLADKANNIEDLKEALLNFNDCDLKKLAKNTVFADGNQKGPIMLIGEAPGNNEDIQGIPFCGESGKLLDNILASINISRKHNAYITNTVFWRPPANRQPTEEETNICRPFVEKHIALIKPKFIILVGNVAATSLLGKNAGISKIRQIYYLYKNKYLDMPIHTTAIFHPAYLLRQPMQKKTVWYDLIKIQEFIFDEN